MNVVTSEEAQVNLLGLIEKLAPGEELEITHNHQLIATLIGQHPLASSLKGVSIPALNEGNGTGIVANNIRALQSLYSAAMLEQLKAFQVVDTLVKLFLSGLLPIGPSKSGSYLFQYWKQAPSRLSEAERRVLYTRVFGIAGDGDNVTPNREFTDLWRRFVSAVSAFAQQSCIESSLHVTDSHVLRETELHKAGQDLAKNLSAHGDGMTYFAAIELQKQVKEMITLLSDPAIEAAYGVRDMWQVIEQVSAGELGGAENSVRFRTLLTSGSIIIAWLAKHAENLASTSFSPVLNLDEIRCQSQKGPSSRAMTDPSDYDLVTACDQWLGASAIEEHDVV